MNDFVALLRGINVGGANKILMADLKELFITLKFSNPVTYLQSGNVVFSATSKDISKIEAQIKSKILDFFGYNISVLVLSKNSFGEIYKNNPFAEDKKLDTKKLCTVFLNKSPDLDLFNIIKNNPNFSEEMILSGNAIYMHYVNGIGKSKVTNNYFESKLKIIATTRNWRTVTNVNKLLGEI